MADTTIPELQLKSSIVGDENMPADNGIQTYRVTPSQLYDYIRSRIPAESYEIGNLTIVPSVGSSALTIALKTKAAADASSTDPIRIGFRSATLTSGTFVLREVVGALSMVVSSGSTLGQVSAQPSRIWVYAIDNAGTVELAVSHKRYRDDELVTTTAEGGAGAADSASAIYSTTARTSVACRCIGYIDNTQATAGTWASAGSQVQVPPFGAKLPTVQRITSGSGTYITPAGVRWLRVIAIGGGNGGQGSGTTPVDTGTATAGDTTFGSSLITGGGGLRASGANANGGGGGVATVNSPAINLASVTGGMGVSGGAYSSAGTRFVGGHGGDTPGLGGAGKNSVFSGAGANATANTGGGGQGGGNNGVANVISGAGGGSGARAEAIIIDPDASYAYAVGAKVNGGTAGASGLAGGNGADGVLIIEEHYI